jgi:hypothetical protein
MRRSSRIDRIDAVAMGPILVGYAVPWLKAARSNHLS